MASSSSQDFLSGKCRQYDLSSLNTLDFPWVSFWRPLDTTKKRERKPFGSWKSAHAGRGGGRVLTQGAWLTAIPSSPGSPGSPWETKNKQKRLISQVHWVADNQPQIRGHRNTLLQLGPLSRSAVLKCMTWLHLTICCFPVNILDSRKQILQPWLNKISYFT